MSLFFEMTGSILARWEASPCKTCLGCQLMELENWVPPWKCSGWMDGRYPEPEYIQERMVDKKMKTIFEIDLPESCWKCDAWLICDSTGQSERPRDKRHDNCPLKLDKVMLLTKYSDTKKQCECGMVNDDFRWDKFCPRCGARIVMEG